MTNAKLSLQMALTAQGRKAPAATAGADVAAALFRQTAYPAFALATGTGTGQVDGFVWTVRELAASASDTLDLFAGAALFTPANEVARFQTLRFVAVAQVANPDGTADSPSITVGGAASNPTALWWADSSDKYVIRGVSAVPLVQGDPIGITLDSTNRNLKVLNNSGTLKANYLLVLAGVMV